MDSAKGQGDRLPSPTVKEPSPPSTASTASIDEKTHWEGHELEKQSPEASGQTLKPQVSECTGTQPEQTSATFRNISPTSSHEAFPTTGKTILAVLTEQASHKKSPFLDLPKEHIERYKAKAKSKGTAKDNNFAAALGKMSFLGHQLLELPTLDKDQRDSKLRLINLFFDGAQANSAERTTAQLRCWYAQMKLPHAPKMTYPEKVQIMEALKAANGKVIPMAAWLLAVIHAGLQEGMEEFANPIWVKQNLAEAKAQFNNHFYGDPLRFSPRQLYPMEPELLRLPPLNDKSDLSICIYLQNMLRGMFGVGCESESVPAPTVDLEAPMKAMVAMIFYIHIFCFNPETPFSKQQTANSKQQTANSKQQTANSKQQRIQLKQIERLSKYTSPRLNTIGNYILYCKEILGMGSPVNLFKAAQYAEKAGAFFPHYLMTAAWDYSACLQYEKAQACLDRLKAQHPLLADLRAGECQTIQDRIQDAINQERAEAEDARKKASQKQHTSKKTASTSQETDTQQQDIEDTETQSAEETATTDIQPPPLPKAPVEAPVVSASKLVSKSWHPKIKEAIRIAKEVRKEGDTIGALQVLQTAVKKYSQQAGAERLHEEMAWCRMDQCFCSLESASQERIEQAENQLLKALSLKLSVCRPHNETVQASKDPHRLLKQINEFFVTQASSLPDYQLEEIKRGFYYLMSSMGHLYSLKSGFRHGKRTEIQQKHHDFYQLRQQIISPSRDSF
ncbi:hypothetical protein [Endozoicomonas arenosclerae]|uniref:hypothetical protein n=1 Tax=Endozoicomonas arenosclerae TaxID=1633495 RepID=UPI000782DB35|nr:hypothetical protein [Endozoicomonas arenosclerae]